MITTLSEFVESIDDHHDIQPLPWCHTTRQNNMWRIMKNKSIVPVKKNVKNGENIKTEEPTDEDKANYFFYGLAKYYKAEDCSRTFNNNLPVCLIFHDDRVLKENMIALRPFDSGGMPLYNIEDLEEDDFEIMPPAPVSIQKFIKGFFGSNENYFKNEINKEEVYRSAYNMCNPLQELIRLYEEREVRNVDYDSRYLTIEIKCRNLSGIFPDCLVLPLHYLCARRGVKEEITPEQLAERIAEYHNVRDVEVIIYSQRNISNLKSIEGLNIIHDLNMAVAKYTKNYKKSASA